MLDVYYRLSTASSYLNSTALCPANVHSVWPREYRSHLLRSQLLACAAN